MSIQVQTAYNVVIDYSPANSWKRTLAYLVDLAISSLWISCMMYIASLSIQDLVVSNDTRLILYIFVVFLPVVFYHFLFEYLNNGQTPGKMLLKIRVIYTDGSHPGLIAYAIRWLFRPLDFTATMGTLAFILIGITKQSQRLGDYVAGTTVINLKVEGADKHILPDDFNFHDTYQVTYPNLLNMLTDRDIQVIVSMLRRKNADNTLLADKLEEVTGYAYNRKSTNGVDEYLRTLLNDYNYLASKGVE